MKAIKNILSFLLVVVILAANSRYAIGKMTCLHSGNVEVNLGKAIMCESDDEATDEISETCCDLQNYELSPDSHFNNSELKISNPVVLTLFYVVKYTYNFSVNLFYKNTYHFFSDGGSPPGIINTQALLSVFRI